MIVTVDKISKAYGKKQVLKDVSFEMENGVYGLFGPNGAGKSTLIRILTGVMSTSGGDILINGKNRKYHDQFYRSKLGYLPQTLGFYSGFSGRDYLSYVATLKGMSESKTKKKIEQLALQVHLTADLDRPCLNYSGGMRRRLGIVGALLNDPEILILDEPTAGLDPHERIKFRNLISLFSRDRTVLLSTHIVSDIESIARQIVMIKDGRVGKMNTQSYFVKMMVGKVWEVKVSAQDMDGFERKHIISNVVPNGKDMLVKVVSDCPPTSTAILVTPTLEDAYLYEFRKDS